MDGRVDAFTRTSPDREILILSPRDSQIFVELLINPPKPNRKLLAAAKRFRQTVDRQMDTNA
jgi:uncharacterized protein (DUF1778 family)